MLFGVNQLAPVLLKCLGISAANVPRFRDCYIDEGRIVNAKTVIALQWLALNRGRVLERWA